MKHSQACLLRHQQWEEKTHEYRWTYPKYCRVCFGWGDIPFESILSPGDGDPCPHCEGRCPRCGKTIPEYWPCFSCEWNSNDLHRGIDPEPLCSCRTPMEQIDEELLRIR